MLVGDFVIAWFREEAFSANGQARVKIFVGTTDDTITLVALNPPERHRFPRSAFYAVHRIFAIEVPDGRVADLRTVEGRDRFVRSQLEGRLISPTAV